MHHFFIYLLFLVEAFLLFGTIVPSGFGSCAVGKIYLFFFFFSTVVTMCKHGDELFIFFFLQPGEADLHFKSSNNTWTMTRAAKEASWMQSRAKEQKEKFKHLFHWSFWQRWWSWLHLSAQLSDHTVRYLKRCGISKWVRYDSMAVMYEEKVFSVRGFFFTARLTASKKTFCPSSSTSFWRYLLNVVELQHLTFLCCSVRYFWIQFN